MPAARTDQLICSFCRRDAGHVEGLVAGPGVHICDRCVGLCQRALKGKPIPPFPGWGSLSDDALLESLAPAMATVAAVEDSVRDQVGELRHRGVSWARIGEALGTSRQAAQQRFGST